MLSDRKAGASDKGSAAPGADLSRDKSKGKSLTLVTQIADPGGMAIWKIRVDPQAPRGFALVTVECALGSRKGSAEAKIEIR